MRYFLTKLTFNNHFDWLYMGNGKFCFSEKKDFKSNQIGNILSIVTFSVFYGDLNYISVCLFEGFWQSFGTWAREPKYENRDDLKKQVSTSSLMVWSVNAKVGNSSSSFGLRKNFIDSVVREGTKIYFWWEQHDFQSWLPRPRPTSNGFKFKYQKPW